MAAHNVKQLLHRQQDPNNMEIIQDYRHTETRERLGNSEELLTYIAPEQNSTHNRTTPNQGTGRFQSRKIMHKSTPKPDSTYRGWLPGMQDYRNCLC